MPSLADIPIEVFIDNLLPLIPLTDLLSLTVTSKYFAALCSDDTFWKRKVKEDYNFSDASSARTKGYRFLYRGVHNAKLYVWGSGGEGRLGLGTPQRGQGILFGSQPYPARLKVPTPRIVELVAGGWSFHALDSEGSVYVWGRLDGQQIHGFQADPFSTPAKCADHPVKLTLPERISKIGCGRAHASALSSTNRVWTFTSWGCPYVLTTHLLSTSSSFSTPCQVECGWRFSAVLTNGGEVYVWWPFDGAFGELNNAHHEQVNSNPEERVESHNDVVECQPWEVHIDPQLVPEIATPLPRLRDEEQDVGERIVKIAAGDSFLIGLTEGGHVLKIDFTAGHASFDAPLHSHRPRWQYLGLYSEIRHLRAHPTFNQDNINKGSVVHSIPDTLTITHISAHFHTFFAYSTGSSSIVLRGSDGTNSETPPDVPPALQNRDVISVVLGDYHFGALTSTGKLLTWGSYSSGALGLGDPTQLPAGSPGGYATDGERVRAMRSRIIPPDVTEPTEVKFGTKNGSKGRDSFVFMAAASGWHMGALIIDLEDNVEPDELDDELEISGDVSIPGQPWYGHMPFRIGLAGARNNLGRGRGAV